MAKEIDFKDLIVLMTIDIRKYRKVEDSEILLNLIKAQDVLDQASERKILLAKAKVNTAKTFVSRISGTQK